MAPVVRCTVCSKPYPEIGVPFLCPQCGGIFDFDGPFDFCLQNIQNINQGMWRYSQSFGLPQGAPQISLGEGLTPLIPLNSHNSSVWLKMESQNPTGSYKDRGSAVLVSQLFARGVRTAVEDSSGNAGASFAAYAARAGMKAKVYVPRSASGPKREQIEAYGSQLVSIAGPRSAAAEAVLQEVHKGATYASHAYLPFGLAGIATIAYEIWQQLKTVPGAIIAPVGHGGLLLGVIRGFMSLLQAGEIDHLPYFMGVQAAACAPVWVGYKRGLDAMKSSGESYTAAEGVRVRNPVRARALLEIIKNDVGEFIAIEEEEILPAYSELARLGIYVEPTSALTWCAFKKQHGKLPEPVVMILTGSGLKYTKSI